MAWRPKETDASHFALQASLRGRSGGESPPSPSMRYSFGGRQVEPLELSARAASPARTGRAGRFHGESAGFARRSTPHMADALPTMHTPVSWKGSSPASAEERTRKAIAKLRVVEAERKEAKAASKELRRKARLAIRDAAQSSKENDQLRKELHALRQELKNAASAPRSAASVSSMSFFDDSNDDEDGNTNNASPASTRHPSPPLGGYGANAYQRATQRSSSRERAPPPTTPASKEKLRRAASPARSPGVDTRKQFEGTVRKLREDLVETRKRYATLYERSNALEAEVAMRHGDESPRRRRSRRIVERWDTTLADPPAFGRRGAPAAPASFGYRAGHAIGVVVLHAVSAVCAAVLALGTAGLALEAYRAGARAGS